MRILLANSPWKIGGKYGVRAGSRWPFTINPEKDGQMIRKNSMSRIIPSYLPFPFFLAYSAAVLEQENHSVFLKDAIAEGMNPAEFYNAARSFDPELVVLETSTPSIYADLRTAVKLKEKTGAKIALTGPHATVMARDLMPENKAVDFILLGEYEYTLRELAEALESNRSADSIKGIVLRKNGRVVQNQRRQLIEDLDGLPFPARHFLPMQDYLDGFCGVPVPNPPLWSSRGCPFRCIFCLWPQVMYGGNTFRTRSPVRVVDEMEDIISKYSPKSLYFDDDTFTVGKARVLGLCKEIRARKMDTPWSAMARSDTVDREMLQAMSHAGCIAVKFGVESGVQALVDRCGKNLDLRKVESSVKHAKGFGIKTHLTFTFGLPGETRATIAATIRFAEKLDPDSVQFSSVTPFPGTKLFEIAERKGQILTKDWSRYDGTSCAVFEGEHISHLEIERAVALANAAWKKKQFWKRFGENKADFIKKGIFNPIKAIRIIRGVSK